MLGKLTEALRGARKVELFALVALCALAAILYVGASSGETGASTALETRMSRALSNVSGAGEVGVMITEDASGNVIGVLIVAEGAGSIAVRLSLEDAVKTLLGIDGARVEIAVMR